MGKASPNPSTGRWGAKLQVQVVGCRFGDRGNGYLSPLATLLLTESSTAKAHTLSSLFDSGLNGPNLMHAMTQGTASRIGARYEVQWSSLVAIW